MKKEYEPFFKKLMSSYYAEYDKFDADLRTNYKQIVIEKHEERIDGITEIV